MVRGAETLGRLCKDAYQVTASSGTHRQIPELHNLSCWLSSYQHQNIFYSLTASLSHSQGQGALQSTLETGQQRQPRPRLRSRAVSGLPRIPLSLWPDVSSLPCHVSGALSNSRGSWKRQGLRGSCLHAACNSMSCCSSPVSPAFAFSPTVNRT